MFENLRDGNVSCGCSHLLFDERSEESVSGQLRLPTTEEVFSPLTLALRLS